MSRIPAALIICGVGFAVMSLGGNSFAAATPQISNPAQSTQPQVKPLGLPIRKPQKPVIQISAASKKPNKQNIQTRSTRDKQLCRALQKCRNAFIKCKGKIKHADQSEAWSIAKEVCGAHYKACVEKDFQGGEWFFTRWFYFQELDCK